MLSCCFLTCTCQASPLCKFYLSVIPELLSANHENFFSKGMKEISITFLSINAENATTQVVIANVVKFSSEYVHPATVELPYSVNVIALTQMMGAAIYSMYSCSQNFMLHGSGKKVKF